MINTAAVTPPVFLVSSSLPSSPYAYAFILMPVSGCLHYTALERVVVPDHFFDADRGGGKDKGG
jgi:hypothetical protein